MLFLLCSLLSATLSAAQSGRLATVLWDPNPASNQVTGYRVHIGTVSKTYTTVVDVGLQTSYVFTFPDDRQTYFLAVEARNATRTSPLSSEVVAQPLAPEPLCVFSLNPPSGGNVSALGAKLSTFLTASSPSCKWTASASDWSTANWFTIAPMSGVGSAGVTIAVAPNQSVEPREKAVRVANQVFPVTQLGAIPPCTVSFVPVITVETYPTRLSLGQTGRIVFAVTAKRRITQVFATWGNEKSTPGEVTGDGGIIGAIRFKPTVRGTNILVVHAVDEAGCTGRTSRTRTVRVE